MSRVWTVWTANDDMETLLVGIATSEEKAYEMRGMLEEEFEDAFEYQVCCMETDKMTINDTDIRFQSFNNDFIQEMEETNMKEVKVYADCLDGDNRGDLVRCSDCGELMLIQIGGTACGECESENLQ